MNVYNHLNISCIHIPFSLIAFDLSTISFTCPATHHLWGKDQHTADASFILVLQAESELYSMYEWGNVEHMIIYIPLYTSHHSKHYLTTLIRYAYGQEQGHGYGLAWKWIWFWIWKFYLQHMYCTAQ